jgi:transcriptional regulator with XRE-family HTH domain
MTQREEDRVSAKRLRQIGLKIRMCREQHGWSQEQLAERATLHDRTIGKIERGELNFSVLVLIKLCTALDYSPNRLLDV